MKKFKLFSLILTISIISFTFFTQDLFADDIDTLKKYIENLEVGEALHYRNLTIIPVYNTNITNSINYVTAEEALNNNWIEISELNGGNVPKVSLSNYSKNIIYIMGGEIISGGKQDRIIGRDALIAPRSNNIVVPVYCAEEGRWKNESKKFYSKQNLGTWNMRATAQFAPAEAQSSIWNDISNSSKRMGVSSRTKAYQRIYEDKNIQQKISRHLHQLKNIPELSQDTVGVVVGIGSRIISIDLFANPQVFRKLWPKILKASALSAINTQLSGSINEQDAIKALRRLHSTRYYTKKAIDLGTELSANDNYNNINALLHNNSVLHIAAFPPNKSNYRFKGNRRTDRRIPVMQQKRFDN